MIILKSKHEIDLMREAGKISARALKLAGEAVEPGVTTYEIDKIVYNYILSQGAEPSFLGYNDYPNNACISVNNVVIHGIPNKKHKLKSGDIVSIDVGAYFQGFHGDNAYTFPCGKISKEAQNLLDVTKDSLFNGISMAKCGYRIGDIGHTIQRYVESHGYSVVKNYVGHGVGSALHEEPSVPNYGTPGHGPRICNGMTLAIEPMVNMGSDAVNVLDDGWTVVTVDGKLSAHFEHSIAITDEGTFILTDPS